MKQIKFFTLVAFIALFSNNLFAKDLKVKVTALGGSLGYSYVYVNGDIKAVADSTGVALIPMGWLEIGDAISASFVGFNGAETIFDSKIEKVGEIALNLTTDFTLDEIVVKSDVNAIYKEHTKKWQTSRAWRTQYNIKFNTSKYIDSVSTKSSGVVSLLYDFRRKKMSDPIRLFYNCLGFEAKGDTTNVINNLAYSHYRHIRNLRWLDSSFRNMYKGTKEIYIKYGHLGIVDNYRAFTIIRGGAQYSGQYIIYFDKDSGNIVRVEFVALEYDENEKILSKHTSELELGLIDEKFTITSFKDVIENYDENKKFIAECSITIEKIKKANYRKFQKRFVEMSRLIVD